MGSSSSTSGGGGAPGTCPVDQPIAGASCGLPQGETCSYGDMCCPRVFGCAGGMWNEFDVNCVSPAACPDTPPVAGSACESACLQASPCGYGCNQGTEVFSECVNGAWTNTESPCSGVVTCGGMDCGPGEICVEKEAGAGIFPSCVPNPCTPGALSCLCAAGPVCGGGSMGCVVTGASQMVCTCPMCA